MSFKIGTPSCLLSTCFSFGGGWEEGSGNLGSELKSTIYSNFQLPRFHNLQNYFVAYCTLISWLYLSKFCASSSFKKDWLTFFISITSSVFGPSRHLTPPGFSLCWALVAWSALALLWLEDKPDARENNTSPDAMGFRNIEDNTQFKDIPSPAYNPTPLNRLSIRDSYLACTLVFFRICKFLKLGGVKAWYKITPHKEDVSILWNPENSCRYAALDSS